MLAYSSFSGLPQTPVSLSLGWRSWNLVRWADGEMAHGTVLFASALAVGAPAVGLLYFRKQSLALRLALCLGGIALALGVFAGVASHLAPISSAGLLAFGPEELAALGAAGGANTVALSVLVLAMAGVLPRAPTRMRRIAQSVLLGSPLLPLVLVFGVSEAIPLAVLPIVVLGLISLVDRHEPATMAQDN